MRRVIATLLALAAAALIGLFALTYLILRIMFDTMVPGNVRLPPTLDTAALAVKRAAASLR